MRISFCSIGFQNNKWGKDRVVERPLAQIIPVLAEAGYDGVEVWYPHFAEVSATEQAALREQLRAAQLAVPMLSSYYDFTSSDETAANSLAHGRQVLEHAAYLGAAAIRIFTGKTGSAEATSEQWTRAVRALQSLADAAAARGTALAFETHARNLMDTVASSLELMRRLDRPNVGLIFQPSTFKEDYLRAADALAPHIRHVHATNSRDGKGCALADGMMDYQAIIARLRAHRFPGFISIEWMGPDPEGMARREAPYLRGLLAHQSR